MLRFLLDEHISPAVADGLTRLIPSITVHAIPHWEGGRVLGHPDEVCLEEATKSDLTLVSFDLRTLPSLLRTWSAEGRDHAGVVLIDEATISQREIGRLIRALAALYSRSHQLDWTNRIVFLRR
jgi:hypothetical protein